MSYSTIASFRSTTALSASGAALGMFLAVGATPLHAQEAETQAAEEDIVGIVVTGRRVSKADQSIGTDEVTNTVAVTREALLSAPSGVSGLKMLEALPGFNVQTDGALGLYEFGNSVQARAFNLDQVGFVVDGIPTGRSDAFGGSPVFRYVDNENLAAVEASPGAGGVSLPSYSSLGPIVQYLSIEPEDELGLFVSQTFGEDDLKRTFVRFNTGEVGPFKAYVSRTKLDSDLWRGAGSVDREHWEGQIHADLGGDSWARFKYVRNDFFDYDSPFLTLGQYESTTPDLEGNTGRDIGYYELPDPTTPGFMPTTQGIDYSNPAYARTYRLAINARKDQLFGLTVHAGIAYNFSAETTLYWEDKSGYGVSPESYDSVRSRYDRQLEAGLPVTAPKGVAYGLSTVGGDRYGIVTKFTAEFGAHSIQAGLWAELDKYHRGQRRTNLTGGNPAGEPLLDEISYFRRDYDSQRDTTQLFLRDTISLLDDNLVVDLGIKALILDYSQSGFRDYNDFYLVEDGVGVPGYGPQFNTAHYKDMFLPTAGLLYKIDGRTQIFASYAETMALPKGLDNIYSVATIPAVPAPEAETAKNYELGIRTNQPEFFGALAAYYTSFDNRIQSISGVLPGSGGRTESFYQNVGGVDAYGAEFTGSYRPYFLNGLAYFNANVTYNIAKFQDDLPTVSLDGNYLPDSAKWIVSGGVTVEPAPWLIANVSGKYTSSRFADLQNTDALKTDDYVVFSGYVDVGDSFSLGPLKGLRFRLNVDNIFDKDVLSFVLPIGTNFAVYRPLAPRTVQGTVSVEF